MVARTASLQKISDVKYYGWAVYTVQVSQNDTVPLSDFDDSLELSKVVLMKESDGSEVTCAKSLNDVTVAGSGTNMNCVLFVYGVKA
jgi:hypothetical protein